MLVLPQGTGLDWTELDWVGLPINARIAAVLVTITHEWVRMSSKPDFMGVCRHIPWRVCMEAMGVHTGLRIVRRCGPSDRSSAQSGCQIVAPVIVEAYFTSVCRRLSMLASVRRR